MVLDAIIIASLYGRATFHDIIISLSYRTRGNDLRIHTNRAHTANVFTSRFTPPRKSRDVKNLSRMIMPYSLIKIRANSPPPYSILNPDTISDSPSAKSKGVRLDSAMHSIIHEMKQGTQNAANHKPGCIIFILVGLKFFVAYSNTRI